MRPECLTDPPPLPVPPGTPRCQAFLDKQLFDPCPCFRGDIQSATQPLAPQKPDHEPRCCPKWGLHLQKCRIPTTTTTKKKKKACHPGKKDLPGLGSRVVAFPGPFLKVRPAGPSCGHSQASSGTSSSWASSGTPPSLQAEHLLR